MGQGDGQWKPSEQLPRVGAPAQEAARQWSADGRTPPRGPSAAQLCGHSATQRPPQGCLEPRLSLVVNLSPGLHRPERTPPRLTPPSVCDVAASPRGQGCLADVPMSCPYQDHARGRSVLSPVPRAGTRAAQPSVVTLVLSSPGSQAQAPRLSPGCLAAPPDHPQPRASTLPSIPLTPASGSTLGGTTGLRRVRSSICLPCHASWGLCPRPGTPAPTEPSPTPAPPREPTARS